MIAALCVLAQLGTVQFHTRVTPDTVYVGQQVSYDAVTLVDDVARARLRANPEYTPVDVQGVTLYDFPFDTTAISDVNVDGIRFRRYRYHRAFFPLTPGRYTVPGSTLKYALPEEDGFFSTPKLYTITSDPTAFVAIPLPHAGKPENFNGAVGQFVDTVHTDGSTPRVGDTFVLTLRISGVGNINLLPRPPLSIDWATVVEGPERVTWDSTGTLVRGAKEFDWVVTPKIAGDVAIPSVRYDYFDPNTRQYASAVTSPIPLSVADPGASTTSALDSLAPARDTIGDTPFPALIRSARAHPLVIAGASGIVLLLILIVWLRSRRRPLE